MARKLRPPVASAPFRPRHPAWLIALEAAGLPPPRHDR